MLESCRNVSLSMNMREFQESFPLDLHQQRRNRNSEVVGYFRDSRSVDKKTSNDCCPSISKPAIKIDEYVEMSATRQEDSLVQGVRRATLIYVKETSKNQTNMDEQNLSWPKKETTRVSGAKGLTPDTELFDERPSSDDVLQESDSYLEMEKPKLPKNKKKRRGRYARTTESPISVGDLESLCSKREKSKSIHAGRLDPSMKNRFSIMHNLDSEQMIQHHSHKTRNCLAFSPCSPMQPLEEVFPMSTSPGLVSGPSFTRIQKLPPILTRRREPTSMADPPSPELKVRSFLPVLQEQPPFSALSNSLTYLSQSAPPCYYHGSPFVSEREKSHSFLSAMDPPSASSSLTSETSLYSSSPTNTARSSLSSSSSLGPIPSQLFQKNEPCYLFPAPPARPANEKERNQRQRRRPGRRLVPLNKIDVAPNHKTKEDIQLEMADIEEVNLEKTENEPFSQEVETVSAKERRKIEEYQRLNPNRRKGICEELENDSNIIKINGQRYNLTMLRHELIQMTKAVTKYNTFLKSFSAFINKDRP